MLYLRILAFALCTFFRQFSTIWLFYETRLLASRSKYLGESYEFKMYVWDRESNPVEIRQLRVYRFHAERRSIPNRHLSHDHKIFVISLSTITILARRKSGSFVDRQLFQRHGILKYTIIKTCSLNKKRRTKTGL